MPCIEVEDGIFQERLSVWGKIWTQGFLSIFRFYFLLMNGRVGQTKLIRNEAILLPNHAVVQGISLHANKCKYVTHYSQGSKSHGQRDSLTHSVSVVSHTDSHVYLQFSTFNHKLHKSVCWGQFTKSIYVWKQTGFHLWSWESKLKPLTSQLSISNV